MGAQQSVVAGKQHDQEHHQGTVGQVTPSKKPDSIYWAVEQWARNLQQAVAVKHVTAGGDAVLMTNRNLSEDEAVALGQAGVSVHATKARVRRKLQGTGAEE